MAKQSVPTTKHEIANAAYLKGEYDKAVELQLEVVNDHISKGKKAITARKLLALYMFTAQDYEAAITLLQTLGKELPDDSEIPENIGVMYSRSGRHHDAVEYLLKAHAMAPDKANICDGLAHSYHTLRKPEQVQEFGRLALELKDRPAADGRKWPVPMGNPPEFDVENRDRNIISFSLFGNAPRYLHGALRNARLSADLYPGWKCRFYCDSKVPKRVLQELRELDCQIEMRPAPEHFYDGLLWRFEVIDDPTIDRFLVRDCDSVINIKERVAVDEWLASDKWFHAMRDFPTHTEVILAGMWGGISGVLPSLNELKELYDPPTAATRTFDQHLLREMVWPTVRRSILIHDSVYTGCLGSVPFPDVGQLPPNRHVGQNEAAVIDKKDFLKPASNRADNLERFFVLGLNRSGTTFLQQLLDSHPDVLCPAEHHLSAIWKSADRWTNHYKKVIDKIDVRAAIQGTQFDREKMRDQLYNTWLKHLFADYAGESVTHVGIKDNNLDSNLPYHASLFPEAKFIFITRDPRDVAVSQWHHKKHHQPGFDRDGSQLQVICETVGREWVEKLRHVRKFNETAPGKIELVRYEDLIHPDTGQTSLNRILTFLNLPGSGEIIEKMLEENEFQTRKDAQVEDNGFYRCGKAGAWKDALSHKQIAAIQKDASQLMEILQYEICPIDHREAAIGDTILPS